MPTEAQIRKQLAKCYKKRQPVLLHGKDDYDREKLVKKIHSPKGGRKKPWEYQGDDDLHNEIKKIWVAVNETMWSKERRERINKLLSDCDDTIRTYRSFNDTFEIYRSGNRDDFLSGQEVFKGLTSFRHKSSAPDGEVLIWYLYERNPSWTDDTELLQYKGTLFIDNLGCQDEDKEWYEKIGKKIESHKRSVHKSQRGWLVFYAYDYTTFPQQFLDQVEPVSLDAEDAVTKEKLPERKLSNAPYLWRGEHPDHSFYAVVSGKKKPVKIKLSEGTQEYMVLHTLYNKGKQRASIKELLLGGNIKGYKKGSYATRDKKPALHKVISSLNKILRDKFKIKYCVQLDEETKDHYSLVITCRDRLF